MVEEHKRNHRRRSDTVQASALRVTMGVLALVGASGGTWVVQERISGQQAAVVDQQARTDIAVLKATVEGQLMAIRQAQEQMNETLRELRDEARRARRR